MSGGCPREEEWEESAPAALGLTSHRAFHAVIARAINASNMITEVEGTLDGSAALAVERDVARGSGAEGCKRRAL